MDLRRLLPLFQILGMVALLTVAHSCKDEEAPVMRLRGLEVVVLALHEPWEDPGVIAFDKNDFDISSNVETSGTYNLDSVGDYLLTYSVSDDAGNSASIERQLRIIHTPASLTGSFRSQVNCQGCPSAGISQVYPAPYQTDRIFISPSAGNSSSYYLDLYLDPYGTLERRNGGLPCNCTLTDVEGQVSANGDTIRVNFTFSSGSTGSGTYTRE